jgi:hypothetical protein
MNSRTYLAMVKSKEASIARGTFHSRDLSTMEKQAMWNGFFDELGKIQFEKQARAETRTFFKKLSAVKMPKIPAWVGPTSAHAVVGAIPGAVGGAMAAKPDERKKGAKRGALFGALVGASGGHMMRRVGRDSSTLQEAARHHKFNDAAEVLKQPKATKQKVWQKADELKRQRPIYETKSVEKTSAKNDDWERPSDSLWHKHRKKIVAGGLALATAAGVGKKLSQHPHMQARQRVKEVEKFYKSQGGFKGKGPVKDVWVGHPSSQDAPRYAATHAEAKVRGKKYIEVDKKGYHPKDDGGFS